MTPLHPPDARTTEEQSRPDPLRHGRIPSLDGLRAVAIVLVLLAHGRSAAGFPSLGPFEWLASLGLLGVEVFFALSGFLITVLLLREFDRAGRIDLRGFYLRRVLRIVPAYALLLGAVAVLCGLGLAALTPGDWAAALTYTMNFRARLTWEVAHLWSLSIEEQFYIIWPPVLALASQRWRVAAPLLAMAAALASRCALLWIFPKHSAGIYGWTFCRLDSIAAGCLLATLAWTPRGARTLDRLARVAGAPALAVVMLVGSVWLSHYSLMWSLSGAYTVNALCITFLVWWFARRSTSLAGRALNLRPVALVGTLSYSLYLWQQLFLKQRLNNEPPHWWTTFPQNLVLAIAAACVSYLCIERPFLRLKDRLGAAHHGDVNAPSSTTRTDVAVRS